MMKIVKNSIMIMIIAIFILVIGWSSVHAANVIDPNDYKPNESAVSGDDTVFTNKVDIILSAIKNLGIVASVISITIIGIRFMFGSVQEKAEFKQVLPGYLIGTFLVFAVTVIPDIIFEIAQKW